MTKNRNKNRPAAEGSGTAKKKKGKSSAILTVIIVLILLTGIGIMLYPTVSDWYNGLHQSRAIADYNKAVSQNSDEENERLWQEAQAYNQKLAQTGVDLSLGQKDDSDPEKQEYLKTLDVSGTGIMGYINIPSVKIHLPIYHDTSESVLQIAVGHLAGTSLPVGGSSTHSVLTGHTGLPSARLFTDIDQLDKGDTFEIVVLDHTLTYEVDDIRTVLPSEVSSLQIEQGRDLVTLVTCTPYGINTHRLLVTGHRIPTPKKNRPSGNWKKDLQKIQLEQALPFIILAAVIVGVILMIVRKRKKPKGLMQQRR